jgi:hypothetical protein
VRVAAALGLAALVAGLGALSLLGALAPEWLAVDEQAPTTCPFRVATHLRCPLCGMTRASLRLFRGDLAGALHLHPLAPLVLIVLTAALALWLWSVATGRPLPRALRVRPRVAVALALVTWAANLLLGHN